MMRRRGFAAALTAALACLCCAFAATGPPPRTEVPSWFWGCWRITRALYPPEGAAGRSLSQVDALIGTHVVLRKGCCGRTARTGLGYPDGGETILAGPAFHASVVSLREFWHFWYFLPRAIGIRGRTVTMVVAQLPAQLSDLDFLAETVYLRPSDHRIVLDVEGALLLAEKLPPGAPGCACDAPAGGRSYSIVGRTPPPPWWRGPWLPDRVRGRIAAIWRCKDAACASHRLAALPHRESTGEAVYYTTLLRLSPHDRAAAIGLLESIPENGAGWTRLALLPERLYTRVNLTFAIVVARHPKYLPRFLRYGTLFADNLYPVLAAGVCRRDPVAFRRALATLSAPDREYISGHRVNPKTCQPIPFHLAHPELRLPPGAVLPAPDTGAAGEGEGRSR